MSEELTTDFKYWQYWQKIIHTSLYTHRPHTFTPNCSKFWFWNTDFCNNLTIFPSLNILFGTDSHRLLQSCAQVICDLLTELCSAYRKCHLRREIKTLNSFILDDLWSACLPCSVLPIESGNVIPMQGSQWYDKCAFVTNKLVCKQIWNNSMRSVHQPFKVNVSVLVTKYELY
jgi:hypothetical protein